LASSTIFDALLNKIETRTARAGIIGLGYVGLPLAIAIARSGFAVTGFDIDPKKIVSLEASRSYIDAVTGTDLSIEIEAGRFSATTEFAALSACDVIVICVPTPLTKHRDPDLSFVEATSHSIAKHLRTGQLVVLESTTYPGTTDDIVKVILEKTGLVSGVDFFVGFSPEREDPGNQHYHTATIPKVVAGDGVDALELMKCFYGAAVKTVVPVSSNATAEAVKLTENIFRSVNIALVNELKTVYAAMGIDVWEVIDAAKTKPFRLYAVLSRAGPWRALHPDRPVLSHMEITRIRTADAFHRARGRNQFSHAALRCRQACRGARHPRRQSAQPLARSGDRPCL
jgi:UDP-N-acetyl-D-glucosamine dehydrogenase